MGRKPRSFLQQYHRGSRRPSVAFAFLLPLLAAYELGGFWLGGDRRNAAEQVLKDGSGLLGGAIPFLGYLVFLGVLIVAIQVFRRRVPILRWFPVLLLETAIVALLLGPVVGHFVHWMGLERAAQADLPERLLLSVGAGVYEELLFRFILLAGCFSLLRRGFDFTARFSMIVALTVSAGAFAAYHHIGPGAEPWSAVALGFRFGAGLILGGLFMTRGLAVAAYVHAEYDVLFDLWEAGLLP